ncbi:LptF/LptG family permease [Arsenicitalea aurantiaca]|nr:LptF/LptG family permease [Arsenicitalea aurantiaca]
MNRLGAYLLGLFTREAAMLFAVAAVLVFLIQCLRIFDLVSVRGQGLWTLMGQAVLTMPALAVIFLYLCTAIGLARALRGLQASHELAVIHSNRRVPALMGAIGLFTLAATLLVLVLSSIVQPLAQRQYNAWSAAITADLVGRSLAPDRFTEIVPGVILSIGGREADGTITDFFADDMRDPQMRRTYIARSALLATDEDGFVLQLRDGSVEYMTAEGEFSRVAFGGYDVALEQLTEPVERDRSYSERTSLDIIASVARGEPFEPRAQFEIATRLGEGLRVITYCLFATALAAFPHGRRRGGRIPIELVVLSAAFLERSVNEALPVAGALREVAGALLFFTIALVLVLVRLRAYLPGRVPVRRESGA